VWWKARNNFRFLLFLAPACVRVWEDIFRKVAAGASPLPRTWALSVCGDLAGKNVAFILRPLLYAADVENGPARIARPDFRVSRNLIGTYGALIDSTGNILVDTSRDVGGGGLG